MTDLVRARLLTLNEGTVEIAHESLVRAWPRLRSWLDDDAAGVRILRHLTTAADGWDTLGRPDGELYRGARLDVALEWRAHARPDLTAIERDFLDAAQRSRQVSAALDARRVRRLRAALGTAVAVLMVAVVAASLAGVSRADAGRARESAQLEALVNQSIALQSTNRDVGALLAVEAYRRAPTDARARSALLATFTSAPGFVSYQRVPGATRIAGAAVPGTRTTVLVLDAISPELVDTESGTVIRTFEPIALADRGPRPLVRPSADGKRVAIQVGASLTVDDIATGARLLGPVATGGVKDLALDPQGDVAVTVADDTGEVTSRRVADGQVLATTTTTHGDPGPAAFDGSGHLVVGSSAGPIRVLDPQTLATVRTIAGPEHGSDLQAAGAGGDLVVFVGQDKLVAVVPSTGAVLWTAERTEPADWFTVSAEAGLVFFGDQFGVIRERSLATGAQNAEQLDIQLGDVGDLSVSNGELVIAGAGRPVLSSWRVDGSGPVTRVVARGQVAADGYDPQGRTFVSAERPEGAGSTLALGSYAVWDTTRTPPSSCYRRRSNRQDGS